MSNAHNLFVDAWRRCDMLCVMHAYLAKTTTGILETDELLRAEWVARVAALDLYVHELIAERMLEIFKGIRPATPAFDKFTVPFETLRRIGMAASAGDDASAAFDLEVRRQLGFDTFQAHEAIAEGIRLISEIELWNSVAAYLGANKAEVNKKAKALRGTLTAIVGRRNKIAHEGDMQPGAPRTPWPIVADDLALVKDFINDLVSAIDTIA